MMIFLKCVHLSNHQALYFEHKEFYAYIKKDTNMLVTFTVFTFLGKKKKQKCVCVCVFLVGPLFSTSSPQSEFNGHQILRHSLILDSQDE